MRFLDIREQRSGIHTSERDQQPIGPLNGASLRGNEHTPPERVEWDIRHLDSYTGMSGKITAIGTCALPFPEGKLTNHKPVAKDEVIKTPKTTKRYLPALVKT